MVKFIIFSILASIAAVIIIYHKDIIALLKKKKSKNKTKPEEPKPKVETYKPEDFKPVQKVDEGRDESLIYLFDNNYDGQNMPQNEIPNDFSQFENISNKDLEDRFKSAFKTSPYLTEEKKTIAQTIKELPPEVKAMLIDNVLKRKDDI